MVYYELDVEVIGQELAASIPGVLRVSVFGSRLFPGKIRSDLDLLVEVEEQGTVNLAMLNDFRESHQDYQPLDLWLAMGGSAVSAVNASVLRVSDIDALEVFPNPASQLTPDLRRQRFRSDITYEYTTIAPQGAAPQKNDTLPLTSRALNLFDVDLSASADALIDFLGGGLSALRRMRNDGTARRGKGTQLHIWTEYDLQNLTELLLALSVPLVREPFVVTCDGGDKAADFSIANGRLVLELKLAKDTGELNSAVKAAHGVLGCYLDHPGVELALAIVGAPADMTTDKNALEGWTLERNGRLACLRVLEIPSILMEHDL